MTPLPKEPQGYHPLAVTLRQLIRFCREHTNQPSPNSRTNVTTRGTFIEPQASTQQTSGNDLAVWL